MSLHVAQIVRKAIDELIEADSSDRMEVDGEDEQLRDRILIGGMQAMQESFIPTYEAGIRVGDDG